MRLSWLGLLLLVACEGPQPATPTSTPSPPAPATNGESPSTAPSSSESPPSGDACDDDDDCLVTNFAGCCACPQCSQAEPHARSVEAQRKQEDLCAAADCDTSICDVSGMCPPGEPASNFVAQCRSGVCAMARK